jgi:hypothetical protein
MSRLAAALVLSLFAAVAFGQTPTVPNTRGGTGPSTWTIDELGAALETEGYGAVVPPGVAFSELTLCGGTATQACNTWTNKSATYVEVTANAARTNLDLSVFSEFRVLTQWSVAAVAADFQIHCDTDANFGSQALLYQLDNPTGAGVGAWTAIPANECDTAGGVYLRAGMTNGNTTEDPAVRTIRLQVR